MMPATVTTAPASGSEVDCTKTGKPVINAAEEPVASMAEPTRRVKAARETSTSTPRGTPRSTTSQLNAPITVMTRNADMPQPSCQASRASSRRTPESRATSPA